MKKIVITYGVISGVIIIGSMILSLSIGDASSDSMQIREILGYLVMIIGLSLIFVGSKKYRDQELGGVISFKTALKIGLGIALVASLIYVVAWEINLAVTDYAFINEYVDASIQKAKEAGISAEKLQDITASLEEMRVQYTKLWYRLPLTFIEIFPVGLIISLISAGLLQNSNILPAKKRQPIEE